MRLDYSAESERVRRSTFLVALIVLVVFFAILIGRLWYLQVIKGDYYRDLSENNRIRSYRIPAPRGRILARDGETLVDYAPSYDLYYEPSNLPDDPDRAERAIDDAARLVGMSPERFRERVAGVRPGQSERIFIDAPREILPRYEEKLMAYDGRFPLEKDTVSKRVYLHVGMLAHVLGYCGEIDQARLAREDYAGYRPGDLIGKTGVEQAFESYLHGIPGREQVEVNARSMRLKTLSRQPAIPGSNLVLSIDADLQRAAMKAFTARAGALVAIDPKTGYILAAHSAPTFDAEIFSRSTPPRLWRELVDDPYKPLSNRVIAGAYPPGSTYKLLMAAAALQEGVVTPGTHIHCSGVFRLGNYPFRCWKRTGHGSIDLRGSIRESCDVYYYNTGQKLGIDRIARYSQAFGLGEKTGLGLLGEQPGIAPTRAWKKRRFNQSWQAGDTISVSIGQGYNLATPLQMANAFAALVNGGTLYRPQIVTRVEDFSGTVIEKFEPEAVRQVPVDAAYLKVLREAMVEVVNARHGTGSAARVPGVTIGGKTGTAQVVIQRGQNKSLEETDYERRDHAWFIGYGPAEDPRIVVAVIAEHAGHGGSTAAPIAQKVLEAYLAPKEPVAGGEGGEDGSGE